MKSLKEYMGFEGKTVVIDGAASGMGLAAVKVLQDCGAKIYALDVKEVPIEVEKFIRLDLADKASIEKVLEQIPGKIDSVMCCAGLPGKPFTPYQVVMVNFVGHRFLIESLLPRMESGGSICVISSLAGLQWRQKYATLKEVLETKTFEEAAELLEKKPELITEDGYGFSKELINTYIAFTAPDLAAKGIRLNGLSPASTATPMLNDFIAAHGKETIEAYAVGGKFATPAEMAEPLVFLNSNMARYIAGIDLHVDNSTVAGFAKQMLKDA